MHRVGLRKLIAKDFPKFGKDARGVNKNTK